MTDKTGEPLPMWRFRRRHPDGRISTYVGAELHAPSAEDAMRSVKLMWGISEQQGWFAERMAEGETSADPSRTEARIGGYHDQTPSRR
jgi:hypothetical protein